MGISLDGPPSASSLRIDKKGVDSTPRLIANLKKLQQTRPQFKPGVLAVLSDATNVPELIDWFPSIGIRSFDLLFPLGNYLTKPIGITDKQRLARTLISGFDYWISKGRDAVQVRFFELLIEGFLGHKISLDSLGGDLRTLCVVESDGSMGMNDVTRFLGGRFSDDKLNIKSHDLDQHDVYYEIERVQSLCGKCKSCEVVNACGGGYLPDRFDGIDFSNPSFYCDVLYEVCIHVMRYLERIVPAHAWINEGRDGPVDQSCR